MIQKAEVQSFAEEVLEIEQKKLITGGLSAVGNTLYTFKLAGAIFNTYPLPKLSGELETITEIKKNISSKSVDIFACTFIGQMHAYTKENPEIKEITDVFTVAASSKDWLLSLALPYRYSEEKRQYEFDKVWLIGGQDEDMVNGSSIFDSIWHDQVTFH